MSLGNDRRPANRSDKALSDTKKTFQKRFKTEAGVLVGLLFCGFVLLPIAVYFIGTTIFGDFAGEGYGDFFGTLTGRLLQGDGPAWFLILSPYLVIVVFRLMAWGWRQSARA